MMQKMAKNQKVTDAPPADNSMGVNWPTIVSAIHMAIILNARARPRILLGNISDAITNFNGPIEKAKHARKAITLSNKKILPVAPM